MMNRLNEKKILIIYTGGTIGMVSSANGYIPVSNTIRDTLNNAPSRYAAVGYHRI
ncbi:MAG: hypothetical protein Q4D99_08695 [Bacillota bacterium]|nr:hypothetical protein [Bacillota bacterium]